jgi:APA family basic amino acid/polyamine antiporter
VLRVLGHPGAASLIAGAAVIALPTVLLAFLYGQTRIFFVMARDGLIPERLAKVNRKTGTPVTVTLMTAVLIAVLAGIFPLDEIAALANAGTLLAFVAVGCCVMVLRRRSPQAKRIFRMPAVWLLAPLGVLGCIYLFTSLPHTTQLSFLVWNVIGVVVYLAYGRRNSRLAR